VVDTVAEVCACSPAPVAAVGITNQRETTVVWERASGRPIHNAIVWQCRRTAEYCERLRKHEDLIRHRTGLPVDAYFSGTKLRWLLDHATSADRAGLAFGTIDTWLLWQLTGGATHATDFTNASRTMLFDIGRRVWDPELCALLGVPRELLPEVRGSTDVYGEVTTIPGLRGVPILGVAGDQQAALFGQTCFEAGEVKNTYGTGCFVVMNTGAQLLRSRSGLVTTLAINGQGAPCYAIEGSIFIAGAAVQWLRDELQLIADAAETEAAARALGDNGGVYFVPAFVGLGAPHWDMQARGTLVGITRGAGRNHIIRATLEAMAYQTHDVIAAMEKDAGRRVSALAVDGRAVANDFLMQFQADVLGICVRRPENIESTALGAAYLAGLRAGVWTCADELRRLKRIEREFIPGPDSARREEWLAGWQYALRQAMTR
jgi:glycerol kinase